jgi:hypothetical protein
MSHFLESSYQQTSKFINFRLRKLLIENLLIYYKFHIPGFGEINSLKILQEVFND